MNNLLQRAQAALGGAVQGHSLAIFRICFGLAIAWSMLKYVTPVGQSNLAQIHYGAVGWHFTYPGFHWIQPLPSEWLEWQFIVTGVAGLFLAAGLFHRAAAITVFLGFTWYFLLDQAYFNNHYYLISLLSFLLIWMPADRCWALRLGKSTRGDAIPFWPVFLLRSQFLILYVYAGIAKFNADWLTGEPIIATGEDLLTLGESWLPFSTGLEPLQVSLFLSWTGLVFDLAIGFLLLLPRFRLLAATLLGLFHGINYLTLPIGVFPFLGFTGSLIFLDPSWPNQLAAWLRSPRWIRPDLLWMKWGACLVPGVGALLGWRLPDDPANQNRSPLPSRLVVGLVIAWIAVQIVLPLRHFAIPGNASWTEEGQLFAWRMMLRQKAGGHITLHVDDSTLIQTTSDKGSTINWELAPDVAGRAIYVPINGHMFRWSDHPGLSTTYEGLLGYRTLFVPRAANADELSQLRNHWQKKTGRSPVLLPTIPLEAALSDTAAEFGRLAQGPDSKRYRSLQQQVEQILAKLAAGKENPEALDDEAWVNVNDALQIVRNHDVDRVLANHLSRVHPFACAGAPPPATPLYFVDQVGAPDELQELSTSLGKPDSYIVWCDFSRLRHYAWKALPDWLPVHEEGRLRILWNSFAKLNREQADAMASRPYMIRQYSREIARRWHESSGRKPSIHAYTYVMMNYRYPHPLVDSNVDMAAVDYRLLKHNEWILPMRERKLDVVEQIERRRSARR